MSLLIYSNMSIGFMWKMCVVTFLAVLQRKTCNQIFMSLSTLFYLLGRFSYIWQGFSLDRFDIQLNQLQLHPLRLTGHMCDPFCAFKIQCLNISVVLLLTRLSHDIHFHSILSLCVLLHFMYLVVFTYLIISILKSGEPKQQSLGKIYENIIALGLYLGFLSIFHQSLNNSQQQYIALFILFISYCVYVSVRCMCVCMRGMPGCLNS